MDNKSELHCIVSGRVQGVAYRVFVEAIAKELNLVGFVTNLPDGSVEVLAQGDYGVLKVFTNHLIKGPPGSVVRGFYDDWREPSKEFESFKII
jgi:acylphosphatase